MYRELTIDCVIDTIKLIESKYEDGLINNIDFIIRTKNICQEYIDQEMIIAKNVLEQLSD